MAHSGRCKNSQLYTEAGLGSENCNYRFDLNVQCQNSKSENVKALGDKRTLKDN